MRSERRLGTMMVMVAAIAAATAGCAMRTVQSFAEPGVDFGRYQRYGWAPADRVATGDPRLDNNDIFRDRVRAAIDRQLSTKGFQAEASGRPDVLVHYHASVTEQINLHEHAPWDACPDCKPFIFDAGTLVIDLVDAQTNALLWRGWAEGNMAGLIDNQPLLEMRIDDTVSRIFQKLPRAQR